MPTPLMRHNPSFLTPAQLKAGFVVRQRDLDLIVDVVRENTDRSANQHVLVIGARGMGKTTLALRVAGAVREDPALSARWEPVIWGEEAYRVATAGEFWLETLLHLADLSEDPRWRRMYDTLLDEPDERRLQERALARLMDFADERGKRLLVVVENLQMVLGEQMAERDPDAGWTLRHTLMNEPRIMLLATSTVRFSQISRKSEALYEMFLEHRLDPLSREECRVVWERVSGTPLSFVQSRPIEILTGGNTRLLSILASFAAGRTFRELMDDLVQLVDDHTDYFKANFEALAPSERRVFSALADLWQPSFAREIARAARMSVNEASRDLGRLESRGAVAVVGQERRAKLYQLTERLYNLYHLMRHHRLPPRRLRDALALMLHVYAPPRPTVSTPGERLFVQDAFARPLDAGPAGFALAIMLGQAGLWPDALREAARTLADPAHASAHLDDLIAFFIEAGAAGQAAGALVVLEASPTAPLVEALVAALQLEAGQTPRVPQEIGEVARDVVERMATRRAARAQGVALGD